MMPKEEPCSVLLSFIDDAIRQVDDKINELDGRILDLDGTSWPKIDSSYHRMFKSPSKIEAKNFGMAIGRYEGKKEALQEMRNYLAQNIRNYLANTVRPRVEQKIHETPSLEPDDAFDENTMEPVLDNDVEENVIVER